MAYCKVFKGNRYKDTFFNIGDARAFIVDELSHAKNQKSTYTICDSSGKFVKYDIWYDNGQIIAYNRDNDMKRVLKSTEKPIGNKTRIRKSGHQLQGFVTVRNNDGQLAKLDIRGTNSMDIWDGIQDKYPQAYRLMDDSNILDGNISTNAVIMKSDSEVAKWIKGEKNVKKSKSIKKEESPLMDVVSELRSIVESQTGTNVEYIKNNSSQTLFKLYCWVQTDDESSTPMVIIVEDRGGHYTIETSWEDRWDEERGYECDDVNDAYNMIRDTVMLIKQDADYSGGRDYDDDDDDYEASTRKNVRKSSISKAVPVSDDEAIRIMHGNGTGGVEWGEDGQDSKYWYAVQPFYMDDGNVLVVRFYIPHSKSYDEIDDAYLDNHIEWAYIMSEDDYDNGEYIGLGKSTRKGMKKSKSIKKTKLIDIVEHIKSKFENAYHICGISDVVKKGDDYKMYFWIADCPTYMTVTIEDMGDGDYNIETGWTDRWDNERGYQCQDVSYAFGMIMDTITEIHRDNEY